MNRKKTNFHHALPAVLSDNRKERTDISIQSKTSVDIDKWVAQLKETYFDNINKLPTKKGENQASSRPMENTE